MSAGLEYAQGSASVLFDLTDFKWEKITACGSGVDFGQQLQGKIDKMAIVSDKKWEHQLTKLAEPLDVKASQFFERAPTTRGAGSRPDATAALRTARSP